MASAERVPASVRGDVLALIAQIKARPDLACDPQRDWPLRDLGFDSMDLVELAGRLARDYGFELGGEPADLEALSTVSTLADLVERRRTR